MDYGTGKVKLVHCAIGKDEGMFLEANGFVSTAQLGQVATILGQVASGEGPHAQHFATEKVLELTLRPEPASNAQP